MKKKKPAQNDQKAEMTLLEHLDELRRRLTIAVIALLIGTIASMALTEKAIALLTEPARKAQVKLQFINITEAPATFFKVALGMGLILAMPVILYQLFMYLRPGLMPNERRYIIVGIPFASLSFVGGVAFALFVALPNAITFLGGFLKEVAEHDYSLEYYLTFVGNVMLWTGLIFETPLVMYILTLLGVVTPQSFAKVRRFVIVGAAIGAAIITPTPDPVNMMLIMGPFLLLYEFGILLSKIAQTSKRRSEQAV
jgi:sec-independent protein translocase protein TatC